LLCTFTHSSIALALTLELCLYMKQGKKYT
jgi:hypothetical protein